MTEHETSAPSATGPNIEARVSFEDTIEPFDAYVAAVGRVAYAWNTLHERLGSLFATVTGLERKVALAKWYSIRSDRVQRAMLRTEVDATNPERSKTRPEAPDDLTWLLDRADELAEDRNNAVHAPCSLYICGSRSEMGAAFFDGNPLARKLEGKELVVEFAWCEGYAETLSRFTEMMGPALAFPDRFPWPERPKIRPREDFSGESRRSEGDVR
jgi:hypothetical protein